MISTKTVLSLISFRFTFGGSVTRGDVWLKNQQYVPTIGMGIVTGDPADSMFTTANFPGASSTDITNARNLYMILAGRVQSITRDARVGEDGEQYNILGESLQKGRMWQVGAFVQDSWRWKPNFTINAGLRYEVQLPFRALNNSYSTADIAAVMGVLTERLVLRPMLGEPIFAVVMITIGLSIFLRSLAGIIFGHDNFVFPSPFPKQPVNLWGITLSTTQVWIMVCTALLVFVLFIFFRYSRMGLAMRGTADDQETALLMGISTTR